MADPIKVPGCDWRPYAGKSTTALQPDIFCAHTLVWTLEAAIEYGGRVGNPYAHLYLGANGYCAQVKDLRYTSAANLEGNWHVIAIETEDKGPAFPAWSGSDVPAWTNAQIDKLVAIAVWCCQKFNIPPTLIPDTKPGRRGLAYHRQGIKGYGWVEGAELWSNATGKVCPGDRRVAQFVNIVVPRVAAIVLGGFLSDLTPDQQKDIYRWAKETVIQVRTDKLLSILDLAFNEDRGDADVRSAIADQLIDIGLERSAAFTELQSKVDEILKRLPPAP